MKLHFKQRFFSWFDSYDIYDENGETVFTVEGQLAWGHKLIVYDAAGNEVGMLREEVLTFLPRFEIHMYGQFMGTIRKEFSFFKPQFNIDFNGWHIDGQFMEWDYTILDRDGGEVAVISKELFHLTDQYVIDVAQDGDGLAALMVVLAIDAEKCSRN